MIAHIEFAREWLGTPYHSQAALRGVGVDCSNLIADALYRAGVINKLQVFPYRLGRTSNDGELMMGAYLQNVRDGFQFLEVQDIQAGDLLVFKFVGKVRHCSIATSPNTHIHTSAVDLKGVMENVITNGFLDRLHKIYRIVRA